MSTTLQWSTVQRQVKQLIPKEWNPRQLSEEQATQLGASLDKFGLVEIPVIDENDELLAGHQRVALLMLRGRGEEVIDVRAPNRPLSEDEKKEYCLRSNKNTGSWDWDKLSGHFETSMLLDIGFSEMELGLTGGPTMTEDDDEQPEKLAPDDKYPEGTVVQIRAEDVTLRIVCGDARNNAHSSKLMTGYKPKMCIAAMPPEIERSEFKGARYFLDDDAIPGFIQKSFAIVPAYCVEGAAVYAKTSPFLLSGMHGMLMQMGFGWQSHLAWVKNKCEMSPNDYKPKFAPVWYGFTPGPQANKVEHHEQTDVWEIETVEPYNGHEVIPVSLMARAVRNSSKRGDWVLSLFGDFGSTAIACVKNNRNLLAFEPTSAGLEYTVARLEQFCERNKITMTIENQS